jgi:hypothetical protein
LAEITVPEPSTLILVAAAGLLILRRVRKSAAAGGSVVSSAVTEPAAGVAARVERSLREPILGLMGHLLASPDFPFPAPARQWRNPNPTEIEAGDMPIPRIGVRSSNIANPCNGLQQATWQKTSTIPICHAWRRRRDG